MGSRLADLVGEVDLIVSSPAARAMATARIVAEAMGYPADAIGEDERIYEAGPAELLAVIRDIDPALATVLLFGHNPGLTQLVNELSEPLVDNVPTCGAVELRLAIERWADVSRTTTRRGAFLTPKDGEA